MGGPFLSDVNVQALPPVDRLWHGRQGCPYRSHSERGGGM